MAKEANPSINTIRSRNKKDDQEKSSRRKSSAIRKIPVHLVKQRQTSKDKSCSEDAVPVLFEELQTTTDKSHLGGQFLFSFSADDTSVKGKSRPEGQFHTPYAIYCASARGKRQLEGHVHT
ncbi:hypothetical protein TNCT_631581 [Trichonephila clavata]|uniref:Uncharacterized protein n=1 Tax=Trichonephila clavata TaxID=2740835 RepID=A0A8X6FMJ2_TRICU|nr:hypothetical protein TNCT_631581 [Trichonephila clavata]